MKNGEAPVFAPTWPSPIAGNKRLPGLDGLRAFAVLLVILAHYVPGKATDPFFERLGSFGVEIFFVLSGFLITLLLLKEEQSSGSVSLRLFYARRALRILPPLFLYLGVLAALTVVGVLAVPTSDLLAGVLFVRNYLGSSMETTHLWTLAIEEQFYLVWPCLLGLCRGKWARLIGCTAIVLLFPIWVQINYMLAGGGANVNNGRTDLKLQPLAIGGLLAFLLMHERFGKVLAAFPCRGPMALLSIAVLAALNFTSAPTTPIIRAFVQPVTAISAGTLINCAIHGRVFWLNAILNFWPLAWIGKLSYSIYLWQELFAPGLPNIDESSWYRLYPVNFVLMGAMACTSYYGFERPLLALRHRWRTPTRDVARRSPPYNSLQ